ncbi:MAG: LysR substrate-binding domain-containing protein [Hyphomicrobiaceae bacterium]
MAERLPLNALQAFEAAARSGSFVSAGGALGVSAAAISQHIRVLEGRFGKQLFHRHANGIELTDAGRELFVRVAGAFAELGEAAQHLRAGTSRPGAVISVIASVGELWLLPRLAELPERAGIQIIEESEDPIDFAARGVDIRITYGATAYPHHAVEVLFQDRMLPVAAPELAAGLTEGAVSATDDRLIHTNWGPTYANAQSWADWHAAIGSARRPDAGRGLCVDRLVVAATAARRGMGVALLPESLVAADLARGTLTAVGPPAALLPQPYVMIARPAARHRPGVEPIWRHLKTQVQASKPAGNR